MDDRAGDRADARARPVAAIVVHDVAPATWPRCQVLLDMIDSLGSPPVTLLVVPHFHRGVAVRDAHAFVDALGRRLARGDELALHGYYHVDEAAAPRSLAGFFARRVLTRSEAEFAAIDGGEAARRLAAGIALFESLGWPLDGFVPPAWQLNAATRRALEASGHRFRYVPVKAGIHRLPDWSLERTGNFCYSPDRAWRRALSRTLIAREAARMASRRLLRLSLHPLDAGFAPVREHWRRLIERTLADRTPLTKRDAMAMPSP